MKTGIALTLCLLSSLPLLAKNIHKQGFHVEVTKLVGNHMPGPAPKVEGEGGMGIGGSIGIGMPGRKPGFPLKQTPVLVFKGKLKPVQDPKAARQLDSFVKEVITDDAGNAQVGLEPGTYTLVAVIKDRCYLNGYDGQGNWISYELQEGKWRIISIRDTSEAAF